MIDIDKSKVRLVKWEAIKAERDRRRSLGVKVAIGGIDKWFHSDDTSRIQQMGLIMMGSNMPSGLQWKTLDNSFVTMTPAIASSIFAAVAISDKLNFGNAEAHRAALGASVDPSAYDFSTGWPACYGE